MSTQHLNLEINQLQSIAELLMGAAYADGEYDGHEAEQIGDTLRALVSGQSLPSEITSHLAAFDIDTFNIHTTCAKLSDLSSDAKLAIIHLVSDVTEADGVHDLAETEYIEELAKALGVDASHIDEFTLDIIEVSGQATPPPLPSDA